MNEGDSLPDKGLSLGTLGSIPIHHRSDRQKKDLADGGLAQPLRNRRSLIQPIYDRLLSGTLIRKWLKQATGNMNSTRG